MIQNETLPKVEIKERTTGVIEAISVRPAFAAPTQLHEKIYARTGVGLEGDHGGDGTITLIEAEVLEALEGETGLSLSHVESRRNVLTRNIDLNSLVDREFRVGNVKCRGFELAEPCLHLEELTQSGMIKALVHRGGLRAEVLSDGWIEIGDQVASE